MSIEKLSDGSGYRVRWRDSAGKSRRRKVTLWRDAVTLDGELKRKKAMGELIAHERGAMRLEDFYELWRLRSHATPRTLDTYGRLWRKHVKPALGRARLKDIRREELDDFATGLKLAPATVRQIIAILHNVLQRAVEWDYIASNPAAGIRKPKLVKQRESRVLSDTEVEALRKELDLRGQAIVAVLVHAGIRPGELRGLRWSDVLPDRIVVTRAVSNDAIGPTKTNASRAVPLPQQVRRELLQWRMATSYRLHSLVFPGRDGGIWTDQGWKMWQRQTFTKAAERAGLKGLVPYDLRHTWVSRRIAAGDDILTIAAQAGHSPTMTLSTYGHLLTGGRTDALQRLAQTSTP